MGWLILAAGRSRRFNGDKLLSPCSPSGETLFERGLAAYLNLGDEILVVTRDGHAELHDLLAGQGVDYTVCPYSYLGVGSSLAWGVAQIERRWPWVGIVLADMPRVRRETLLDLKREITQENIVVPRFFEASLGNAVKGHPVLFGGSFFKHLTELSGDKGARVVLGSHKASIVEVSTQDAGVILDVDSRSDLRKLIPEHE